MTNEAGDLFEGVVPFVIVAEARSFKVAAERLGLSAAAISKAIKRLEDRLGVRLLHRTTRRVSLSAEGELYLASCREAVEAMRSGQHKVAMALEVARGDLTVSTSPVLARVLTRHLPRFVARYPQLDLHLRFSDRYTHLIDEQIDVALRIGELEDSTLLARRLMTTRWVTVASPAYVARRGQPASLDDLDDHDGLGFLSPRGVLVPWVFLEPSGDVLTVRPARLTFDADLGDCLIDAAVGGMGIVQVFDFLVAEELRAGRLVELLPDRSAPGPPIHAVCLPGQTAHPRVRAFLDFATEVFSPSAPAAAD